jgi:DnaJ-class molecular chaperone
MSKRDDYEILGVGRDADEAALKSAFRKPCARIPEG